IAAAFAAPRLIAMLLRGLGWEPVASRNHGTLVQPPFDISELAITRQDGSAYQWQPLEARFHLLVRQDGACDAGCAQLADMLHRVWAAQGRQAERIDVLWLGTSQPETTRLRHGAILLPTAAMLTALHMHALGDSTRRNVYP